MRVSACCLFALLAGGGSAAATDYTVDFSRMDDLEALRPLVDGCKDFDAMELYRERMQASDNLERMRSTLSAIGLGMFNDCPAGISGPGITALGNVEETRPPDYAVDFSRLQDLEVIRPLVAGCSDFGALEHFRPQMESARDLNELRDSLAEVGVGVFDGCPKGITGPGITTAADVESARPSP